MRIQLLDKVDNKIVIYIIKLCIYINDQVCNILTNFFNLFRDHGGVCRGPDWNTSRGLDSNVSQVHKSNT